jgi:hypothetical protein
MQHRNGIHLRFITMLKKIVLSLPGFLLCNLRAWSLEESSTSVVFYLNESQIKMHDA